MCIAGQTPTTAHSESSDVSSSDCEAGQTWFPPMYITIDGDTQWWPGGCAPLPNAELLPDGTIRLQDGTLQEPPLDLGQFTVVGRPINNLIGTLLRLLSPLPANPPPPPAFSPPPRPSPPPPPPPPEENESGYFFGVCSVPLGQDYRRHRTDEEWEAIRGDWLRHDDVIWSIDLSGGGGSWGIWSANSRDAAGLHPASKEGVWWLGNVPGVIETPRPDAALECLHKKRDQFNHIFTSG